MTEGVPLLSFDENGSRSELRSRVNRKKSQENNVNYVTLHFLIFKPVNFYSDSSTTSQTTLILKKLYQNTVF